jgi:hypothetical protein
MRSAPRWHRPPLPDLARHSILRATARSIRPGGLHVFWSKFEMGTAGERRFGRRRFSGFARCRAQVPAFTIGAWEFVVSRFIATGGSPPQSRHQWRRYESALYMSVIANFKVVNTDERGCGHGWLSACSRWQDRDVQPYDRRAVRTVSTFSQLAVSSQLSEWHCHEHARV